MKNYSEYTALQRSIIERLAEIEQEDAEVCEHCGGEVGQGGSHDVF